MKTRIDFKKIIDDALTDYLSEERIGTSQTAMAMRYAVNTGGKRVRPQLLLAFLEDLNVSCKKGIIYAAALEIMHTYSLVHDDLPAMDNDDYRRNQLTVHKKFTEDIAILAGDGLLTYAFELLNETCDETGSQCSSILARNAGCNGMILGQELDIDSEGENISLDQLINIHKNKTGRLFAAPLMMASVIGKRGDLLDKAESIGHRIGLAFQIQDDILDVTENLKKKGEISSDIRNNKTTYVSLTDIETAKDAYQKLYLDVVSEIKGIIGKEDSYTVELLESLVDRSI